MKQKNKILYNKGGLLIQVIAFMAIGIFMISGIVSFGVSSLKMAKHTENREQALQVAEAGIEYYRWHLAHNPTDFYDGNGATSTGPYKHDYNNKDGVKIGEYELTITPFATGSTVVIVKSVGRVMSEASSTRTIISKLAKPSYAKYGLVSNSSVFYGPGDDVYGEIYSNGTIRFDSPAKAHNMVTSMVNWTNNMYYGKIWGVSCTGDPTPQTMYTNSSCPNILMAGRRINAPQISFNELSLDLASLRTKSIANGSYRGDSGAKGYLVRFKIDDTYDLYKVNTVKSKPGFCKNDKGEDNWDLWSVNSTSFISNSPIPSDGIIFIADDLWIEGQINTARVTIAAGRNAAGVSGKSDANIIINEDLLYTNKDGQDVIGAIAEDNVFVGLYSADDLEIDGALIAQKGAVKRLYYSSSCSAVYYIRSTLRTFGMYVTYGQPYFAFNSGGVTISGYASQPAIYDGNLLYSPPPSFPLTTDQYQVIGWEAL